MSKKHKILPSRILGFIGLISSTIGIVAAISSVNDWISTHVQFYFIILLVLFVFYLLHLVHDIYDELQSSEDKVKSLKDKYSLLSERRQRNRIKISFAVRNSISHYNRGYTAVSDIQNMLQGIENIYTTLFLPSLEWKEAHPGQQLPEPGHQNK